MNGKSNITIEALHEHFQSLNKNDEEDQDFQLQKVDLNEYDNILNGNITEDKIIRKVV